MSGGLPGYSHAVTTPSSSSGLGLRLCTFETEAAQLDRHGRCRDARGRSRVLCSTKVLRRHLGGDLGHRGSTGGASIWDTVGPRVAHVSSCWHDAAARRRRSRLFRARRRVLSVYARSAPRGAAHTTRNHHYHNSSPPTPRTRTIPGRDYLACAGAQAQARARIMGHGIRISKAPHCELASPPLQIGTGPSHRDGFKV